MDGTIYLTADNKNIFLVVKHVGNHLEFTVFVLKMFEKWKKRLNENFKFNNLKNGGINKTKSIL